jgi:E3 ubiquitin-protein ligase DOA10
MHLTVIPFDKQIYLETPNAENFPIQFPNRRCHIINNDQEFWNNVDSRIHAIQYHSDGLKQIEYNNPRENVVITDISIIQKYIDRFNLTEQTYQSQCNWDKNNVQITLADGTKRAETQEEKVARIGPRP